jgi:hypothetical protein
MIRMEMTDAEAKKMTVKTISINSKLVYLCIIRGIIHMKIINADRVVWISV